VHKTNIDKVVKIGSGTRPASGSFCAENRSARESEKNRINREKPVTRPVREIQPVCTFFSFSFYGIGNDSIGKKKGKKKISSVLHFQAKYNFAFTSSSVFLKFKQPLHYFHFIYGF
jgi:hypothetical protein